MLILTDVETLYRIPDNELNKLTAKDRVIIFSRAGSQMPMSKFQALAAIKAKMEIIEYQAEIESLELSDQSAYTGYLFGAYAATAKAQEPVKIYSALFDRISKIGSKAPAMLKAMGKVQICTADDKKGGKKAPSKRVAEKKPSDHVVSELAADKNTKEKNTEAKPAKPVTEKKARAGRKTAEASPLIEKMCSLGLSDMRTKLIKNEEQIRNVLKASSDPEIGYKFQLKLYLGEADSEKIWDKTAGAFDQLKSMV